MDYLALARELMDTMKKMHTQKMRSSIGDPFQGGMFILQYLYEHEQALLPSQISDKMNISTARIAVALRSLEQKQLIKREINVNDRRQILVTLTEHGKAVAISKRQLMESKISNMLMRIGEKDAMELKRILDKIVTL